MCPVKLPVVLAAACAALLPPAGAQRSGPDHDGLGVRLAGLDDRVPELFLRIVNDKLKGHIRARVVDYQAPSSVVLEDALLTDPSGAEVARVRRASATLSLTSLLAGDIVISRIELAQPLLSLRLHDKKLNLIEALTPKKPPDKNKPQKAAFRIDAIIARNGGFTFTDEENVTVTADTIDATASLEIDLAHDLVVVDVKRPTIKKGAVRLKQLDVPLVDVRAAGVRVVKNGLEITAATARAAGAKVTAHGKLWFADPGSLDLRGTVDAPKNAWPERLKRLPFDTPPVHASVDVTGPFSDPRVHADGTFAHAEAYGYDVDAGRGVIDVTKDVVHIEDGTWLKAGGVVAAAGTVKLPGLEMNLSVKATDVPVARALEPAKLDPAPKGVISGRATLTGVADGEKPITVDASATARRAEISAVKMRGNVDARARVVVRPKRVSIESATLRGDRLDATVHGDVFTEEQRLALDVTAGADDATALVPAVPADIHADGARFEGTVNGPYHSVVVDGRGTAARGDAYGVPVGALTAHVAASATQVLVDGLTARAAGGAVSLKKPIVVKLKDRRALAGTVRVARADLARIALGAGRTSADGEPSLLAGVADVEAVLGGTVDNPVVALRAAAGGLEVSGEDLGAATARATVSKNLLQVTYADVRGGVVRAHTDDVRLTLPDLVIEGHAHVESLALAGIQAARKARFGGTAQGLVIISGDAKEPEVVARLGATDVSVGDQQLGAGAVDVTYRPEAAGAAGAPRGKATPGGAPRSHVATLAAHLEGSRGAWDVVSSYAVERRIVNAHAEMQNVDLSPFTTQLGKAVSPLEGFATGAVDVSGPLEALDMRLHLRSPEVAVARASPGSTETQGPAPAVMRPLGPLLVDARMDGGSLNARICAFTPEPATPAKAPAPTSAAPSTPPPPLGAPAGEAESPCTAGERVWATIVGDVDGLHGTFDLAVVGQVEEPRLEDLLPALAARDLSVGAKARADAQIVKAEGKPVDIRAEATLLEASVQPPGSLRADLAGTSEVLYADRRVKLVTPARFASPSGDVDVVVAGSVGIEDIDLNVKGSVGLGIAKAFTPQIANASGTAQTSLVVRGRYDKGISVEGTFTPNSGAVVTPRALGEVITFTGGSVAFAPLADNADGLIRVNAKGLKARVGDGDLTLNGLADVRTARQSDRGYVAHWDLVASGSNLVFKLPTGRAEGALDLTLEGDEAAPRLKGRVEVTEGLYRKTFELRNFILQAPPDKASDPLYVTLTPLGLENLELDVGLSLQGFRVRANMANFDADLTLRGDLQLKNTLRVPRLDGAVEVEEGTVDFPRARFEVVEMQIEFPTAVDGKLNPLVHATARTEIPPGAAGTNDTEIPVDLFLDGDLKKGITLDLSATDPQREWTRSELLGFILFGRTIEDTVQNRDVNIALRALTSEATAPVTAELEQLAQQTFGGEVNLDIGGWRWQLGRRLQLEGPGLIVNQQGAQGLTYVNTAATTATSGTATTLNAASTTDQGVRLRLLIYDHLPIGKNLSLEGSTGGPSGGDLRLSLRLFEE